jgi:NYN domain
MSSARMSSVRRSCISVGRSHHIIDIENLYGEHRRAQYEPWFADLYAGVVGLGPTDLVSVAADHKRAFAVDSVFPGARRLVGRGVDGADVALIDSIDWPSLARGCDTVVIASGDYRFVDVAYRARSLGLRVVVVSRRRSLSRYLKCQGDEVIEFPEFDPALPPQFVRAA